MDAKSHLTDEVADTCVYRYPEAQSLLRSPESYTEWLGGADGTAVAQEGKHVAWYSLGSQALRHSRYGQLLRPARDRKMGDKLPSRHIPTFPLGPSFLLLSLHPNSCDISWEQGWKKNRD